MWICVKDIKGKYLIDMDLYENVECYYGYCKIILTKKNKDFLALEYRNYDEMSNAYDYIKKQLCKKVEE